MSEEEYARQVLARICEKEIYSNITFCREFAQAGSKKCRQILKERYGEKLGKPRTRYIEKSAEEKREERNRSMREYYAAHREERRKYMREYMTKKKAKKAEMCEQLEAAEA